MKFPSLDNLKLVLSVFLFSIINLSTAQVTPLILQDTLSKEDTLIIYERSDFLYYYSIEIAPSNENSTVETRRFNYPDYYSSHGNKSDSVVKIPIGRGWGNGRYYVSSVVTADCFNVSDWVYLYPNCQRRHLDYSEEVASFYVHSEEFPEDTIQPVFNGLEIGTSVQAGDSLFVSLDLSDPESGIEAASITLFLKDTLNNTRPITGFSKNGSSFEKRIPIDVYDHGLWKLEEVNFSDNAGFTNAAAPDRSFEVLNEDPDTTPPTILSIRLEPDATKVSEYPNYYHVLLIELEDDKSGLSGMGFPQMGYKGLSRVVSGQITDYGGIASAEQVFADWKSLGTNLYSLNVVSGLWSSGNPGGLKAYIYDRAGNALNFGLYGMSVEFHPSVDANAPRGGHFNFSVGTVITEGDDWGPDPAVYFHDHMMSMSLKHIESGALLLENIAVPVVKEEDSIFFFIEQEIPIDADTGLYKVMIDLDAPELLKFYSNYSTIKYDSEYYLRIENPLSSRQPEPNLAVYPNPSEGVVRLRHEGDIDQVCVFDLSGKLLEQLDAPRDNELNLTHLDKGIYLLKITCKGYVSEKKLILR